MVRKLNLKKILKLCTHIPNHLLFFQIIITTIPQHSFGLVIYGEYLFWTDWMLRAVVRANKYDGTGVVWLRKNLERQPMGIIAFANDSADCTINACHDNKFGCEDICFTSESGEPSCQCRYGRLKPDGKKCECKCWICLSYLMYDICQFIFSPFLWVHIFSF